MSRLLAAYRVALRDHPFRTNVLVVGGCMSLGDVASQAIERRLLKSGRPYNPGRTLRMGIWGMMVGPPLTGWYRLLSGATVGFSARRRLLTKVVADQTIWAPINMATFIAYCSLTEKRAPGAEGSRVAETCRFLRERFPKVIVTNWCIWPLIQCVTFGLIPLPVLFVNFCSLLWSGYLSFAGH